MMDTNRNTRAAYAAALILLLPSVAAPAFSMAAPTLIRATKASESARIFEQWGEDALNVAARDLWLPQRSLYADKFTVGETAPKGPAFMWGCGVQLPALAAAAQVEPRKYLVPLRTYADALGVYWTNHNGVGGYDVLPAPKPSDRYYDDNAWIVLALAETAVATQDRKYLDRSEETFRFVISGEDDKLGGGIYWQENKLQSKNTCSNAPTITAALRLYQLTKKPQYLQTAIRLYHWTCSHLQDTDGLFWDNVKMNGDVDKAKFSYNSALMIRADSLFYAISHQRSYLTEAERIARAAEAKWVTPDTGALADGGRFAHLLDESFLAVYQQDHDSHWLKVAMDSLVFLHDKVRDPMGRYGDRWDKPQPTALTNYELINQASAARAYWVLARTLLRK